jgi:DeoR family fructose operon transcriptional repressor
MTRLSAAPHRTVVPAARRAEIVQIVNAAGAATVGELARALAVSPVTVHRDLQMLERDGMVQRAQGGAVSVNAASGSHIVETAWSSRLRQSPVQKARLGFASRQLVSPGDTIFVDGSSTCLALAAALEADPIPITLITDSPAIANSMLSPEIRVVTAPGYVDQELRLITGPWVLDFLAEFNFTSAFVSCAGITAGKLSTERREIRDVIQHVIAQSQAAHCLADSSKFGTTAMMTVCHVSELTTVITDGGTPQADRDTITGAGTQLVVVDDHDDGAVSSLLRSSNIWRTVFAPS